MSTDYTVILCHAPNPDIAGGYWSEHRPANKQVSVKSFAEAATLCREYIHDNELGAGNWAGGQVFKGTQQVARISYNGRVWGMDGNEI